MIELLELYFIDSFETWIADGVEVDRKFLVGKRIQNMIVRESLTEKQKKMFLEKPMSETIKNIFGRPSNIYHNNEVNL